MGIANSKLLAHLQSLLKACLNCGGCSRQQLYKRVPQSDTCLTILATCPAVRSLPWKVCYCRTLSVFATTQLNDDCINMDCWWKPVEVPLCSPQIPHGLAWNQTRASVERGRRMTVPRDLQLRHILISRLEEMSVSSVPVLLGLPIGPV